MTRWQRQFEGINNALLGLAMSGAIRDVIERHECPELGEAPVPDAN